MPQPEKLNLASLDIAEEQKARLKTLFPEVFTEGGKIDFERLKLTLGESVDTGKERYGMNWPGKAECFKTLQKPSMATLMPRREESVDFDTTENLILEGDNLEALKLLQKSYLGKVKMIYIDPPYNTGNDFIYPDNYSESLQTYLEYTGQVDAQGRKFSTNTEADGRFHSKWMNMMYPRLFLARNLLREDGVIFISIDDHEAHDLRFLMNDIFGEENFLIQLIWHRRQMADSRNEDRASTDHEYVVAYKKSVGRLHGKDVNTAKYQNPDNDPRGAWFSADLTGLATKEQRPNLHYDLVNPQTGLAYPPSPTRGWSCAKDTMSRYIQENRILWPSKPDGRPRHKKFLSEVTNFQTGFSSMLEVGHTTEGTRIIQELFNEKLFPFSKPVGLISELIEQVTAPFESDIILDFFAGSGTTAQAVLELNKQDGGNRKFILVQLPEPTGRKDFPTIADITKERVRRVITKLKDEESGQLTLGNKPEADRGFKVFQLQTSNFKPWNADAPKDTELLAKQLEMHLNHIEKGRSQEDILYEILLKSGFPISSRVENLNLGGKTVYSIAEGTLLICLEKEFTEALIKEIASKKPSRIVLLDSGFAGNDQLKTNAAQTFKAKGVSKFVTV